MSAIKVRGWSEPSMSIKPILYQDSTNRKSSRAVRCLGSAPCRFFKVREARSIMPCLGDCSGVLGPDCPSWPRTHMDMRSTTPPAEMLPKMRETRRWTAAVSISTRGSALFSAIFTNCRSGAVKPLETTGERRSKGFWAAGHFPVSLLSNRAGPSLFNSARRTRTAIQHQPAIGRILPTSWTTRLCRRRLTRYRQPQGQNGLPESGSICHSAARHIWKCAAQLFRGSWDERLEFNVGEKFSQGRLERPVQDGVLQCVQSSVLKPAK